MSVKLPVLFLFLSIAVILSGCGAPPPQRDTMTVRITWGSDTNQGDCDLGIEEPTYQGGGYDVSWIDINNGESINGYFSIDERAYGTETWTMYTSHYQGVYTPIIFSDTFIGSVEIIVTMNGISARRSENISINDQLRFADITINRNNNENSLQYKLIRTTTAR